MFKQRMPLPHTHTHTFCRAHHTRFVLCVRKTMSSAWTCCPAEQAQHGCAPRKRAPSPKNKAEEAQDLSAPAGFPFFHFFCGKTGQPGCEHRHSHRAPNFAALPWQHTALPHHKHIPLTAPMPNQCVPPSNHVQGYEGIQDTFNKQTWNIIDTQC